MPLLQHVEGLARGVIDGSGRRRHIPELDAADREVGQRSQRVRMFGPEDVIKSLTAAGASSAALLRG